jgi:hypothetical protein
MSTLFIKIQFLLHCLRKLVKGWLLRLGCILFSSWHYIGSDIICTAGKVLKVNNLYTYKEDEHIDIVRLKHVHIERGYLYCSLFFTSKNETITVRHILKKGTHVLWRLMDKEEFGELMSIKLWCEVTKDEELLEFDF